MSLSMKRHARHHVNNIGYECKHCKSLRAEFAEVWFDNSRIANGINSVESKLNTTPCPLCHHPAGVRQVGVYFTIPNTAPTQECRS